MRAVLVAGLVWPGAGCGGDDPVVAAAAGAGEPRRAVATDAAAVAAAAAAEQQRREALRFLEMLQAGSLDALDESGVEALVTGFVAAVVEGIEPPPGAPPMRDAVSAVRAAASRLNSDWVTYFEYYAAWRAIGDEDLLQLRAARDRLLALERDHPDQQFRRHERAVFLADIERVLGNPGAALERLDPLLRDAAVRADPELLSKVLGVRGDVLRETGRLEEAKAAVAESMAAAFASGDERAIQEALLRDQSLALSTGAFAQSRRAIEAQLAAIAGDTGAAATERRALLLVFRGYAESGLANTDPDWFARARATLDEARPLCGGHLLVRTDLKRLDLALRAGDVAGAERVLADCDRSLGPIELKSPMVRDMGERIGLETRLCLLRGADAAALGAQLPRQRFAQRELAREWRDQPPSRGGIGFLHPTYRRALLGAGVALEQALARAEGRDDGPERALQALLDLQAETSLARARGAAPTTVDEVQRVLLAPGRAVLLLLPTREDTWTFLVRRDDVELHRGAGDVQGDADLAEVMGALMRSPNVPDETRVVLIQRLEASGPRLRQRLLPGALAAAVASLDELTVVGDDLIGGLPLEALPLPDGRLLGEVVAVDHTASLPLEVATARVAATRPRDRAALLQVACTDPDAVAEGIHGFALPRDDLARWADGYHTAIERYGDDATRTALLDQDLAAFDVVHVMAHHAPRIDTERGAGMALHDGPVWRSDLDGTHPRGLVLVSSCSGAAGPGRNGEGVGFSSFAGGFLWAGARCVIASRGDLLVRDHARLLHTLNARLLAGASPARALQAARAELAPGGDLLTRAHRALLQVTGAGQLPLFSD
ncbi:MAG: CHAT domain-containing protein [Planctomycetota bacterium]